MCLVLMVFNINIFKAREEAKKVVEEKIHISVTKREKEQVAEPAAKGIISFLDCGLL